MPINDLMLQEALEISKRLDYMCQTQVRGPNLARNIITIGTRDYVKCELELARGIYHVFYFKFNFSCICNAIMSFFQIQCLSKIKGFFHMKG